MAKAYKSEAFAALHESMSDLHQVGAIDSKTMREFDRACLTPVMVALAIAPTAVQLPGIYFLKWRFRLMRRASCGNQNR